MASFNMSSSEVFQEWHLKSCAIVWETSCSPFHLWLFWWLLYWQRHHTLIHLFTAFLYKLKYEMVQRRFCVLNWKSLDNINWYMSRQHQYTSCHYKMVNVFQKIMQKTDDIPPKFSVLTDKKKTVTWLLWNCEVVHVILSDQDLYYNCIQLSKLKKCVPKWRNWVALPSTALVELQSWIVMQSYW